LNTKITRLDHHHFKLGYVLLKLLDAHLREPAELGAHEKVVDFRELEFLSINKMTALDDKFGIAPKLMLNENDERNLVLKR
jgi:hypothetical protein